MSASSLGYHAFLAKDRITNSGSAAMTIRSARAAASGWRGARSGPEGLVDLLCFQGVETPCSLRRAPAPSGFFDLRLGELGLRRLPTHRQKKAMDGAPG